MNATSMDRQTVTWACGALKKAGWHFEATEDGKGWYVETPTGWEDANNVTELAKIARRANGNPI